MNTLYKLTTSDWKTRPGKDNETQWGPGVSHRTSGKGGLCNHGWIHAYFSPELAVLLDIIHGCYGVNAVLWRCEGEIGMRDGQLKVGCTPLTTIEIVEKPTISTDQRVRFAILCALEVCNDATFRTWAANWLSGESCSKSAAWAAAAAALVNCRELDLVNIAKKALAA